MLTRREVLTGTAAASIGAIASAHGVAAAEPTAQGELNCGFGNLTDGVIARFDKPFDKPFGAINVFVKFEDTAAELFYKPQLTGEIELFFKFFSKGWSETQSQILGFAKGFGADAYFEKVGPIGARFFFKSENDVQVTTDITSNQDGLNIFLKEATPDDIG